MYGSEQTQDLPSLIRTTEKFTVFKHNPNDDNSLLSNSIYDIKQMKDGKIWICTNMGGVSISQIYNDNAFISAEEIDFQNIKATNDNYGLSSPNARCAYTRFVMVIYG